MVLLRGNFQAFDNAMVAESVHKLMQLINGSDKRGYLRAVCASRFRSFYLNLVCKHTRVLLILLRTFDAPFPLLIFNLLHHNK